MARSAFNDNYPGAQLGLTLLFTFSGILAFSLLSYLASSLIFGVKLSNMQDITDFSNPKNIEIAKFMQLFLSAGLFIVVPLVLAWMFSGSSFGYLKIDRVPDLKKLGWAVLIILAAIPLINLLATLNEQVRFPGFMSPVEKYLMDKEKVNDGLTDAFLNVHTLGGFSVNLLIIAIIPAFGEEFFFRGILQRIFTNLSRNTHWGIIISGFIFSAIHMQFYGFFPRWLLGIMFGYMFVWSGSLWLPILAHFINNSLAVVTYYLVNEKIVSPKLTNIGSGTDMLSLTIPLTLLMAYGLYRLYRTRLLPENG